MRDKTEWRDGRTHFMMWEEDIAEAVRLRKQGWSLRAIADKVGFGQTTVGVNVKKVLGEVPRSNSHRLDEAKKLLAEGKSLREVAEYLGYDDPYGMSKMLSERRRKKGEPRLRSQERARKGALLWCEGKSWEEIKIACEYSSVMSARSTVTRHMKRRAESERSKHRISEAG